MLAITGLFAVGVSSLARSTCCDDLQVNGDMLK